MKVIGYAIQRSFLTVGPTASVTRLPEANTGPCLAALKHPCSRQQDIEKCSLHIEKRTEDGAKSPQQDRISVSALNYFLLHKLLPVQCSDNKLRVQQPL